jgi:hypothetical protein
MSIQKAERKVLNDRDASERLFRELEKTRPCANDTSFVVKMDTIYNIDTTTYYKYDTINNVVALKEAGKTIYKTQKVIETKLAYIVDNRRLAIALDSLRYFKTLSQVNKDTSNSWRAKFWYLILIIGGIALFKLISWRIKLPLIG